MITVYGSAKWGNYDATGIPVRFAAVEVHVQLLSAAVFKGIGGCRITSRCRAIETTSLTATYRIISRFDVWNAAAEMTRI